MSVMFNGEQINGITLNGHKIVEGRLNGQVLFKFEGTPYMSFEINASSFKIPFWNANYGSYLPRIVILWGDGTSTTISDGNITGDNCSHTYPEEGTYTIQIYSYNGKIPRFSFQPSSGGIPDPDPASDYAQYVTKFNTPLLEMITITGRTETSLRGIFYGATNLQYIPENLFDNNTTATDFSYCFYEANSLSLAIPENLFSKCSEMKNASYIFASTRCEIPTGIFNDNTKLENLSYAFNNSGVLGEYIDLESMFMNLVNLKNLEGCFSQALISSLPNLNNNTNLENVSKMFYQVTTASKINVPSYYFRNNINITDFSYCFSGINSSVLSHGMYFNKNIFCDEDAEMTTRFAGRTINFSNCFSDGNIGVVGNYNGGTVPQLWNYTFGSVTKTSCFSGTNNKYLTNYYVIPEDWGGPYKENSMSITVSGTEYTIPFTNGTYNIGDIVIDWGDGSSTTIANGVVTDTNKKHTYSLAGTYDITISNASGKIPLFGIGRTGTIGANIVSVNIPLLTMVSSGGTPFGATNYTFANSDIENVCDDLYKNNSQIFSLSGDFYNCDKLSSVPSTIFSSLINLEETGNLFAKDKKSHSGSVYIKIPEDIFSKNINITWIGSDFQYGYIDSIPNNLYKNNTKIEELYYTFASCKVRDTQLPQDLFRYNTNVEKFTNTFMDCYIKEIPEYFLKYNTKATSFISMFAKNVSTDEFPVTNFLQMNKNIFCDENTDMGARFSNMTVNFSKMFEDRSIEGTAPSLWKYSYSSANGTNCFKMSNSITSYSRLTNGGEIPVGWGGSYIENTMKMTIDTTKVSSSNVDFSLPFNRGTYSLIDSLSIDWGDGETTSITSGTITQENIAHTYSSPGTYQISIFSPNGNAPNFGIYNDWTQVTSLDTPLLHSLTGSSSSVYITNIKFRNANITKIADRLFYFNPQLTSLSEAFSYSPLEEIPYGLFIDLTNLNSVSSCFYRCQLLTTIPPDIFRFNPNITDFSSCFNVCGSVINIGTNLFCDEDTEKETRFSQVPVDFTYCFSGCGGETLDVDLWNYNYFYVRSSSALDWKDGSLRFNIPEAWGGSKRELDIIINGDSFVLPFKVGTYSNLGTISVNWGDGNATSLSNPIILENISHAYSNSSNYKIQLVFSTNKAPVFSFFSTDIANRQKVTRITGVLPLMIDTDDNGADTKMIDFTSMFEGCTNLTTITNSNFLSKNNSGSSTKGYSSAEKMFYNSGLVYAGTYYDSLFYGVNCNNYQSCFSNCNNLTTVPYVLGALIYNNCFNGCSKLNFNPNRNYDIFGRKDNQQFNYCFANCTSLTNIPSSFFQGNNIQCSGTFYNCINLRSVYNAFGRAKSLDYSSCFQNCNKLSLDKNLFSYDEYGFEDLEDGQIVDMSYLFNIQQWSGTSRGTAPEIWNYAYVPTNYTNIFQQENDKHETKSGVEITYNVDSSISINGTASAQTDFVSNTFTFGIDTSSWYNFILEHTGGEATQSSSSLLRISLTNSLGIEYYSKVFTKISDLDKWEGIGFPSSSSNSFQLTVRVYGGNSYDNLVITPKLLVAKVKYNQCFRGHTTASLTNYNDIPDSWK